MIKFLTKHIKFKSLTLIFIGFVIFVIFLNNQIPNVFFSEINDEKINLNCVIPVNITVKSLKSNKNVSASESENSDLKSKAKIFNVIPIKNVKVRIRKKYKVICGGWPFVIKTSTDGVLVVDTAIIETENGDIDPLKINNIKAGDIILEIDNKKVNNSEMIIDTLENSDKKNFKITVKRENKIFNTNLTLLKDLEGKYRAGIIFKSGALGIGTISFIKGNIFLGLGHGIKDENTKKLIPVKHGEIFNAYITSICKSRKNYIGELKGSIVGEKSIGKLEINNNNGVFGTIDNINSFLNSENNLIPIAFKQDVKIGNAEIIFTLEGCIPQKYEINIEKIDLNSNCNKDIYLKITDKEFLSKSEGIMRGMSGSPIVQNGQLIGILNYVSAQNTKKGYAIFSEKILETLKLS